MVGRAAQTGDRAGAGEAVVLGQYDVLTLLATGGMAQVYVGRRRGQQGFQRLVAIKRLRAHLLQNAELASQFAEEARMASLIQHPNVVSIHDVHQENGELFLVMDYIDGVSLADLTKELSRRGERLGVDVALRIMVDVLRGLHAAHELRDYTGTFMNVVHRDATPTNVLLGRDGSVRITDFGVAKAIAHEVEAQAAYIKEKFCYMAPEQASGQALDRRVDIFAIGAVLWELLAGRQLFAGGGYDALHAVFTAPIEAPSTQGGKSSPALDEIVLRALDRDRDRRFLTAAAFADELEDVSRSLGGMARPTRVAEAVGIYCLPAVLERETRLKDVLSGRASPIAPEPPSKVTLPIVSDSPPAARPAAPTVTAPAAAPLGSGPVSASSTLPMKMLADDSAANLIDVEVDTTTTAIMQSPLANPAASAPMPPRAPLDTAPLVNAPLAALAVEAPAPAPAPAPAQMSSSSGGGFPQKSMGTMLGMAPPPAPAPAAVPAGAPYGGAPAYGRAAVAEDPFKAAPVSYDEPPSFQPDAAQVARSKRMRTIVLAVIGGATLLIVAAAVLSTLRGKPAEQATTTSPATTTAAANVTATPTAGTARRGADPIPPPPDPEPVATATPTPTATVTPPPRPDPPPPPPPVATAAPPPATRTPAQPLPPPPPPAGKGKPSKGNIVRDAPF